MSYRRYNRQIVLPSFNKTEPRVKEEDLSYIYTKSQHLVQGGDRWGFTRSQVGVNFSLDWQMPHTNDYSFNYTEDDFIQPLFPETNAPWKFPDNVYVASGLIEIDTDMFDGFLVEPPFFDPDPTLPPSDPVYKVDEHALPSFGIRVMVSGGGFHATSVDWGPEHNIDKDRGMLCAPLEWQGTVPNSVGESWSLQGHVDWSLARLNNDPESGGFDFTNVKGSFPGNPLMPHGDPEPLWGDGLDDRRIAWKKAHRTGQAPVRGSTDMMVAAWGDFKQGENPEVTFNPAQGEFTYKVNTGEVVDIPRERRLLNQYDFTDIEGPVKWADPAHFGKIHEHNYPRQMTGCLMCFSAARCKASNNHAKADLQAIVDNPILAADHVGTTGFKRNLFVDVPGGLVPPDTLAQIYANSFCMYSTNTPFDKNFAAIQQEGQSVFAYLQSNDNTSDVCHINGAPRRVVEYDGHYKLLIVELMRPLIRDHRQQLIDIHNGEPQFFTEEGPFLKWKELYDFPVEAVGIDYQGNNLYKVMAPRDEIYPFDLEMGQYKYQYRNDTSPVLFYFSVKYSPVLQDWTITKVCAYIWYVTAHKTRDDRILIRRLVELKADYGTFYGNLTEARVETRFTSGDADLETLDSTRWIDSPVKRGAYIRLLNRWIWTEGAYTLSDRWNTYKSDHNARASGYIDIVAQPGEIIPAIFLTYTNPQMISWGKSRTDQNTQNNLGKTRWHFDERKDRWVRETGETDDLYYHLRYDDPRAEGAVSTYPESAVIDKGYYDHFLFGSRDEPLNSRVQDIRIADPLEDPVNVADIPTTEPNTIVETDLALMSDMMHARNFTAPIFAYNLTSRTPSHHIVTKDFINRYQDWGRRTMEPDHVVFQREYCPTSAIWTFSKNTHNRESHISFRPDTNEPIELVFRPEGRVWWHRAGILSAGREWGPQVGSYFGGDDFSMTGIAIINMWRKYLPHHMEVVRAYLWLEPTLDHTGIDLSVTGGEAFALTGSYNPFEGVGPRPPIDNSQTTQDIRESKRLAGMYTDIPGHHPNFRVSQSPTGEVPVRERWDDVVIHSKKLMGEWSIGGCVSFSWGIRQSQVWSEYELNHTYAAPANLTEKYIARNITCKLNGQPIQSIDPDNPHALSQRSHFWYDVLPLLYQDGGLGKTATDGSEEKIYYRNANRFVGMNTRKDLGEGVDGLPDPDGKAYGYSTGGGGRKVPFIFDITHQVRRAYSDRIDCIYQTESNIDSVPKFHTSQEEAKPGNLIIESTIPQDQVVYAETLLRGNLGAAFEVDNLVTIMDVGKSNTDENVIILQLLTGPVFPNPDQNNRDSELKIWYRTTGSALWRKLFTWHQLTDGPFDILPLNNQLKEKPLVCSKLRFEIKGTLAKMPGIVDIEYVKNLSQIPVTGPSNFESFNEATSIKTGAGSITMYSMPLREIPIKVVSVGVYGRIGVSEEPFFLSYGGKLSRHLGYVDPDQGIDVLNSYFYDPVDNAILIVATSEAPLYDPAIFKCEIEYITSIGSTALVPISALIPGPSHDVDKEAINIIHPDDISKLPADPDEVLQWAVLNQDELQGGYQYHEPEYVDTIQQQSLESNPGLPDPRYDPEYQGRGTNWIKIGKMPDTFDKDEEDYKRFWILPDGTLVSDAWKTRARGYVTFYGPPNSIIPGGIKVVAPAKIKHRDPFTQEELLINSPSTSLLSPQIPNGGMKPAPLVLEMSMGEDDNHPSGGNSRKVVAFRPQIMIYLRERTSFLGAVHWKELGEGWGKSSEVTGTPYWL